MSINGYITAPGFGKDGGESNPACISIKINNRSK